MPLALAISVRFHEGRYYGSGHWPPSPARLFQALLAGATLRGPLEKPKTPETREATENPGSPRLESLPPHQVKEGQESLELWHVLAWLGSLPPPIIGAPSGSQGQRVGLFVPSNDLDLHEGDLHRLPKIRGQQKIEHPWFFDDAIPLLYLWRDLPDTERSKLQAVCSIADLLYQLGRGLDMAWAYGEILDASELEDVVARYPGRFLHPTQGYGKIRLSCPSPGSLDSLLERYRASRRRFVPESEGKKTLTTLCLPPPPSFREISYGNPPARITYELRSPDSSSLDSFVRWPLVEAATLVGSLRDEARRRLEKAAPSLQNEILRAFGDEGGTGFGPAEDRLRVIPLPSIGHAHADRCIRRVLIEIPPSCPLEQEDVAWAFSGLETKIRDRSCLLVESSDHPMLRHYGMAPDQRKASVWRTVTPVVLRDANHRTRRKNGSQRAEEESFLGGQILQALRYVHLYRRPETIRVQREPFEGHGERADAFAVPDTLSPAFLWHVELRFSNDDPLPWLDENSGLLLLGEGRFHGLGILAPFREGARSSPSPSQTALPSSPT